MEKPLIKINFLRFYLACIVCFSLGPLFAPSSFIFLIPSFLFGGKEIASLVVLGSYMAGLISLAIWVPIFLLFLIFFGKKILISTKMNWLILGGSIGIIAGIPSTVLLPNAVFAGAITAFIFRQILLTKEQRIEICEYHNAQSQHTKA